jgi:hypothetical protein
MAQLHADPAAASARLLAALLAPDLPADAASQFKDLQFVTGNGAAPEPLDWINTFKTGAAAPPVAPDLTGTPLEQTQKREAKRAAALAHARERYAASQDPAWMLAALALMQPDEATDAAFMAAVAAVGPSSPAYFTALYHRIRLTEATADPAALRPLLDTVLARPDLTTTTRNLFLAERLQVAASLAEFANFAQRRRVCVALPTVAPAGADPNTDTLGCHSEAWGYYGSDAHDPKLGDDATYLIDRLSLATRAALAADSGLPSALRLDIALTSFARAVLLHDDAMTDRLAVLLRQLLPVMAADFAAVTAAHPGPDKLFAEYFIFAKIPGLRADLLDYSRPVGSVADFGGTWPNWVVLAQPDMAAIPPAPVSYLSGDYAITPDVPAGTDLGNGAHRIPDAVCEGLCGAGGFVPHEPAFLADTAAAATRERRFLPPPGKYGDPGISPGARALPFPSYDYDHPVTSIAAPPGATYMWEYLLTYASEHPRDPRAPETLHWLIHIGHYGQSHDHTGRRAFQLLKSRYPTSSWAKQNQFYYD